MTTESTSMKHSNILHTCTRRTRLEIWRPERTTSTKHTGFERKKLIKKKKKKEEKKKQTNECNAEKYLQILNIHYIQTRGLLDCRHGDDDGEGRREPSGPKHRTCSGVSWQWGMGGRLGVISGIFRG